MAGEESTPAVEVFPFSREELCRALANPLCPPEEVESGKRSRYLFEYLTYLEAATLVVEREYIDADYLDDFAEYYVRCFAPYRKRCKRIHLFRGTFTKEEFLVVVGGDASEEIQSRILSEDCYLGFVIAKPLPDAIIGRTCIRHYEAVRTNGARRCFPATREYPVNLYGLSLSVPSLAYQEQDSVVAACATVALWCAFQKTADLFHTLAPSPSAITRSATQLYKRSRPIPSTGLIIEQFCSAVSQAGLEQELFDLKRLAGAYKTVPLCSLLYGYLKFGLPVIVGGTVKDGGRHAVTLTGYAIGEERERGTEIAPDKDGKVPPYLIQPGLSIQRFYSHDDQIGPFAALRIADNAEEAKRDPEVCHLRFERHDPETGEVEWTMTPEVVIVPIYHKVRITFLEVQQWCDRLNKLLTPPWSEIGEVTWDIFLTGNSEVKRQVRMERALGSRSLQSVLCTPLPRFLWRAVLSCGGSRVAELLLDATEMKGALPVKWVLWYDSDFRLALAHRLRDEHPLMRQYLKRALHELLLEASLVSEYYCHPQLPADR